MDEWIGKIWYMHQWTITQSKERNSNKAKSNKPVTKGKY
jgi:hypothetical protein